MFCGSPLKNKASKKFGCKLISVSGRLKVEVSRERYSDQALVYAKVKILLVEKHKANRPLFLHEVQLGSLNDVSDKARIAVDGESKEGDQRVIDELRKAAGEVAKYITSLTEDAPINAKELADIIREVCLKPTP